MLFFGLALVDAIQIQDWIKIGFWLFIGAVFLLSDTRGKQKGTE